MTLSKAMARIKGLEVLFSLNQKDLKSKEDCIVVALHCILINSDYSCVGIGEVFSDGDSDSATELLPENWNDNQNVYCLRYQSKNLKNRYLLKIVKAGNNLHVCFVLNEANSSGMTVNTDEYVSEDFSKFSNTYKNLENLNDSFRNEIIKELTDDESKSGCSASAAKPTKNLDDPIPSEIPFPSARPIPVGVPDSRLPGRSMFPEIGGSDLDPLGRRQGGMHFDPFGAGPFGRGGFGPFGGPPTGLPPGAVPPGARFDPLSPIQPSRFNPDPDHYRPPDYDNMFM